MRAFPLTPINLSDSTRLDSLVEHRRVFNLPHCELNIFETFRQSPDVTLSYDGLVVSSMMRGRKIISLDDSEAFDFLPGETVILPQGLTLKVAFPEADEKHPVQCATLALDWEMVNKNLAFLNEQYPNKEAPYEWKLNFEFYHFVNNKELASTINKLINISMEAHAAKEAMADLSLKFLLLRLIQTQNMASTEGKTFHDTRFIAALRFVRENLTEKITVSQLAKKSCMSESAFYQCFKDVFGITPMEYVLKARIEHAKKLMADPHIKVTDLCYASGFNNVNHFINVFKRIEGMTPNKYRN